MSDLRMFPDGPPPQAPRTPIPFEVVLGASPVGGWAAASLALGVGGAVYASARHDLVHVRPKLLVAAAVLGLLALAALALWAASVAAARRLYRDGALVAGRVTRRVELRRKAGGGALGHRATVQFRGPDGAQCEATFDDLNQVVAPDLKLLVAGERAGLYLSAYRVGPLPVPAIFRQAHVRLAPPA